MNRIRNQFGIWNSLLLVATLLLHAGLALAQVTAGVSPTSVIEGHAIDSINLQNLNIMLNVPVMAKAGAMPMQSPATNFASHERVIQDLIVKAYRQCQRFLEYLASQSEVPIFRLIEGEYVETA